MIKFIRALRQKRRGRIFDQDYGEGIIKLEVQNSEVDKALFWTKYLY